MVLFTWLEERICFGNDSPTTRRRKVIAYIPAASTFIFLLVWSAIFWRNGLATLSRIHLVFALLSFITMALPLLSPRLFNPAVAVTAVSVVGLNFMAHAVTGGFATGVWFLIWTIVIPFTSYLASGWRVGALALVLALGALLAAYFLDERFALNLAAIPDHVRLLYNTFVLMNIVLMVFLWGIYIIRQLDIAREQADALLLNILPAPIADRLKKQPATIADGFNEVTVLFADIVGFTRLSAEADAAEVVEFLNELFTDFDQLAAKHGLEKIKTIGDAYMVAGGLPTPRPDHCRAVADFALDMLKAVNHHTAWGRPVSVRIGINTGPVVAGVIGRQKFIYDLWGDAVNTASRMESYGLANLIQVTEAVKLKLDGQYDFEARPPTDIKGKGMMVTYILRPLRVAGQVDSISGQTNR